MLATLCKYCAFQLLYWELKTPQPSRLIEESTNQMMDQGGNKETNKGLGEIRAQTERNYPITGRTYYE
jgi:hypothetical protein